jgi:glycosyltransferase involved in cell wall biosynthesis
MSEGQGGQRLGTLPLSVAVITRNEAHNLARCLDSAAAAAQIVVVDTDSEDQTVAIARSYGCEVYGEPWRGFGPQKQFAVDRCTQPWVLILDADESLPAETQVEVERIVLARDGDVAGYRFPRKNIFQGQWIRHAGWWPDRVVRLFRKGQGRLTAAAVHEAVEIEGTIRDVPTPIAHFTESDMGKLLRKIDQYATLGARAAQAAGKKSSPPLAVAYAFYTFLNDYVFRRGFMDGSPGLTLAMTDAIHKFVKYFKLYELNRLSATRPR